MQGFTNTQTVKVQFMPVGRHRREWMWKARDEDSNTITISGQRFDSLTDAVRDARTQILADDGDDEGPAGAGSRRPRNFSNPTFTFGLVLLS
jgi:hypothetical protein